MTNIKNTGTTESERYLYSLASSKFFSLWSHANVFRDERIDGRGQRKELCDILVVFGNHIIIFSDKESELQENPDIHLAWSRWLKPLLKSSRQAAGAEDWLRENPDKVYLDEACTQPLHIPRGEGVIFHKVLITRGISAACREKLGESGTLMINTFLEGINQHVLPFQIGHINPEKGFFHVFDDEALDLVIDHLTTFADFVDYLSEREKFLRGHNFFTTGEEELLGYYLLNMNEYKSKHIMPKVGTDEGMEAAIIIGKWEEFNLYYRERWFNKGAEGTLMDNLIEKFCENIAGGTLFYSQDGLYSQERGIRELASTSRMERFAIGTAFLQLIRDNTKAVESKVRVSYSGSPDKVYVLVSFPLGYHSSSYEEYRKLRYSYLEKYVMVAALKWREVKTIIGLALNVPQTEHEQMSEDLMVHFSKDETPEFLQEAEEYLKLGLLSEMKVTPVAFYEFAPAISRSTPVNNRITHKKPTKRNKDRKKDEKMARKKGRSKRRK